jgi:hypothetical protein
MFALGVVASAVVITLELKTLTFSNSSPDQGLEIGDGNFISGVTERWLANSKTGPRKSPRLACCVPGRGVLKQKRHAAESRAGS